MSSLFDFNGDGNVDALEFMTGMGLDPDNPIYENDQNGSDEECYEEFDYEYDDEDDPDYIPDDVPDVSIADAIDYDTYSPDVEDDYNEDSYYYAMEQREDAKLDYGYLEDMDDEY